MTRQEGLADRGQPVLPPASQVVELLLLLPSTQFAALEGGPTDCT
jgi:hypothetical protein